VIAASNQLPLYTAFSICKVALLLGSKERFAVEVGEWRGGNLRRVDAWAAGQWLTCDDNTAFVRQLRLSVQQDLARLDSIKEAPSPFPGLPPAAVHQQLLSNDDGRRERWGFLRWGPTTDNLLTHVFRDGDHLVLTGEFWREEHLRRNPEHRGAVFVAEIEAEELAGILQGAVAALGSDPPDITVFRLVAGEDDPPIQLDRWTAIQQLIRELQPARSVFPEGDPARAIRVAGYGSADVAPGLLAQVERLAKTSLHVETLSLWDLRHGFRDERQRRQVQDFIQDRLADDRDRYLMRFVWQLAMSYREVTMDELCEHITHSKLQVIGELIQAIRQSPAAIDDWIRVTGDAWPLIEDRSYQEVADDDA
jgi:hypothetical protein